MIVRAAVLSSVLLLALANEQAQQSQPTQPQPSGFTTAPQCKCSDIEECSVEMMAKTNTCKNDAQCVANLKKIGDDVKIRQCLDKDQEIMMKLENCAKKKVNGELGCTNSANPQNLTIPLIPVVELPAMEDDTAQVGPAAPGAPGPQGPQGPPELNQYLMCVDQCSMSDMDIIPGKRKKRSPVSCAFKLKCALAPPSPEIQKAYGECEKELNIDPTKRMAESCSCLKEAGVAVQC